MTKWQMQKFLLTTSIVTAPHGEHLLKAQQFISFSPNSYLEIQRL